MFVAFSQYHFFSFSPVPSLFIFIHWIQKHITFLFMRFLLHEFIFLSSIEVRPSLVHILHFSWMAIARLGDVPQMTRPHFLICFFCFPLFFFLFTKLYLLGTFLSFLPVRFGTTERVNTWSLTFQFWWFYPDTHFECLWISIYWSPHFLINQNSLITCHRFSFDQTE